MSNKPVYFLTCSAAFSNKDNNVLSINLPANAFAFKDFNLHHKDLLTCFGGKGDLMNSLIILLSQTSLLR